MTCLAAKRDASEVVGAVLGLADHRALIVEFGHPDGDLAGLAVELDAGLQRRGIVLGLAGLGWPTCLR